MNLYLSCCNGSLCFSEIIDSSKVRVRNLIERERNSNQSKAFSTEDSTDVVQKSNKKRYV